MQSILKASSMALAFGATLSACASAGGGVGGQIGDFGGLDVVSKVRIDSFYSPSNVSALTAGGADIEILGAPGGDPQAVADVLRFPSFYRPRPFNPITPGVATPGQDRFVLVFGSGLAADGASACRGQAQPNVRPGFALAAFCDGERSVTEGLLRSNDLEDPSSPAFADAFRQLFRTILPIRNPEDRDRRRFPL